MLNCSQASVSIMTDIHVIYECETHCVCMCRVSDALSQVNQSQLVIDIQLFVDY